MTNEELERAIQFILQQQAQFWTSVQSLEGVVRNHTTQIVHLTDVASRHDTQIVNLIDVVSSLARIVEEQGQRMVEQGRRTDEHLSDLAGKLNTLVDVVERHFSNGHTQ